MKRFNLYCIALLIFSWTIQSCGVYYTATTASLDWCTNNGDTLGHWDNIVLSTTINNVGGSGNIVGSSTEINSSIKMGGGLSFLTNDGRSEYICGGLIHLYNIDTNALEDVNPNLQERIEIKKRFEFSDAIYYNYGGKHLFLGNNYNEAYKTLISLRDKSIVTQDVVNIFTLMKGQYIKEKEYGTQYNTIE